MNQPGARRRDGITARKLALPAEHKSFGTTVLVLAVIGAFIWPNLIAPNEAALKHHFWHKDDVLVRMLPNFRS